MAMLIYFTVVALAAYIFRRTLDSIQLSRLKSSNNCSEAPRYPHRDPFLGLDLFLAAGKAIKSNRLLDFTQQLFDSYGKTFQINSWGKTVINTMEPANIQTVLSTSFTNFGVVPLPPTTSKAKGSNPLMSRGIFTADGAIWEHNRALIRPTFSRQQQISDFGALEGHFRKLLALLPRNGETVDLKPLLKRFFLDTSTEFLFGESVDSLSPTTPFNSTAFLDAFNASMRGLAERMQLGKFAFIRGRDTAYKEAVREVHKFIDGHVSRVLGSVENDPKATEEDDEPRRYILVNEMAKQTQDPIELRYALLNVFFPAHDATVIAVSDILFHLARDIRVQNKLRAEVLKATANEPMRFELLKSITYLRYVFNESLRLHPLQGRLRRVCHQDTVLPTGGGPDGKFPIMVLKGTSLVLNTHAMHHDKALWGENADEFIPERWETERPSWNYLPFGGGPRICPAQQMVFTESAFIVVRLLQEFGGIQNCDPEEWTELFRMTVEVRNGVKVRMVASKDKEVEIVS